MRITAPLRLFETRIKPEWLDEFNHVNIAHYLTICDQSNWAFWNGLNAPNDMSARDGSEYAILENHVNYIDELALDEPIYVTTQLLSHDDKRFILFHHLFKSKGDRLSATNEVKMIGFNLETRSIETWSEQVRERLESVAKAHTSLPVPDGAGKMALKR